MQLGFDLIYGCKLMSCITCVQGLMWRRDNQSMEFEVYNKWAVWVCISCSHYPTKFILIFLQKTFWKCTNKIVTHFDICFQNSLLDMYICSCFHPQHMCLHSCKDQEYMDSLLKTACIVKQENSMHCQNSNSSCAYNNTWIKII